MQDNRQECNREHEWIHIEKKITFKLQNTSAYKKKN